MEINEKTPQSKITNFLISCCPKQTTDDLNPMKILQYKTSRPIQNIWRTTAQKQTQEILNGHIYRTGRGFVTCRQRILKFCNNKNTTRGYPLSVKIPKKANKKKATKNNLLGPGPLRKRKGLDSVGLVQAKVRKKNLVKYSLAPAQTLGHLHTWRLE